MKKLLLLLAFAIAKAASSTKSDLVCMLEDTAIGGDLLEGTDVCVQVQQDCDASCGGNSECSGWGYFESDSECALFDGKGKQTVMSVEGRGSLAFGLKDGDVESLKGWTSAVDGKEAILQCLNMEGKPVPTLSWTVVMGKTKTAILQCLNLKGKPVPASSWSVVANGVSTDLGTSDSRISIKANGNLVINEVGLKDSSDYVCSQTNNLGTVAHRLKVYGLELVTQPKKTVGYVGRSTTLKCEVNGIPTTPSVKWSKGDINVESDISNGIVITGKGDLMFTKLGANDAGIYTCRATNDYGTVNSNPAKLEVSWPCVRKGVRVKVTVGQPVTITNPNYPLHSGFAKCRWYVSAPPGFNLVLRRRYFELGINEFAWLKVGRVTYRGGYLPSTLKSGGSMNILFESDIEHYYVSYDGFKATITAVPK